MSNIISFSLWGNNSKYCQGAIKNAKLAVQIYSDYKCRFYVDNEVPKGILFELEDLNCEIIEMNCVADYRAMFWRFEAINDADVVLIRDCDSRLNEREKKCVNEFIKSDKLFHTIHDHPFHQFFVMPGLMAFKRQKKINFKNLIKQYGGEDRYGTDYSFFQSIYNLIKDDLMIHDNFFDRGKKINHERNGLEFCGQVFDENDETVEEHQRILENVLEKIRNY